MMVIVAALLGVVVVVMAAARVFRRMRPKDIEVGSVSEGWIAHHRGTRHD